MPVIRTETFAPAALWPRSLLVALLGGSSLALLGACSPDAIPTATTVTPASGSAAAAVPGAAVPGSPASLSVQAAAPASERRNQSVHVQGPQVRDGRAGSVPRRAPLRLPR